MENCLATNFDIAVIRCLFVSKWSEEGIFWSVTYLHRRLKGLNFNPAEEPTPRKRSNSLPVPKVRGNFIFLGKSPDKEGLSSPPLCISPDSRLLSRGVKAFPSLRLRSRPTSPASQNSQTNFLTSRSQHWRVTNQRRGWYRVQTRCPI